MIEEFHKMSLKVSITKIFDLLGTLNGIMQNDSLNKNYKDKV